MTPEERHALVVEITAAIACTLQPAAVAPTPQLTEDELRWIKLAIEAEGRKIKFRDAVIQHTFTGLAWLAVLGLGLVFKEFIVNHFWKP